MPTSYIMVGVPASGKSTWIKNQHFPEDTVVISTDAFVEAYAEQVGKTYSEVFEEYMPTAIDKMMDQVVDAVANGSDIVWDQTSTTVATRAKKLRHLHEYNKVAVVVPTPAAAELQERLASRPGKNVPWEVVSDMAQKLETQPPTLEEGFDALLYVGEPPRCLLSVKREEETDESYIYVPGVFLGELGWNINDKLEWIQEGDVWIIRKSLKSE